MGVGASMPGRSGRSGAAPYGALPVIALTVPVVAVLQTFFPVTPVAPLPPTGTAIGFAISLLAGVIVAPFGEELFFRGFATTAWAAAYGKGRGLVQGAIVFAFAHVLTISGAERGGVPAGDRRVRGACPVALVLGWLFLRRGSIWASFGLHATFNGILLVIGEVASRSM